MLKIKLSMNNTAQFSSNTSYRRMAIAVLVSVILHALFFGGFTWRLPSINESTSIIEAQLVKRAAPKLQDAKPIPIKVKKTIRKEVVQPIKIAQPVQESVTEPVLENPTQHIIDDRNAPVEYVGAPVESSATTSVPADEAAPKPYAYVVTEFDVKRGRDANSAGSAKIVYQALPNQHYSLSSEMKAKGLLSLFIQQRTLTSEGLVTDNGLQPINFKYQVAGNKEKSTDTVFDWQNRTVIFHSSKGEIRVDLPDEAQDLLSFMYQFMFVPPLNKIKFNVTNGKAMKEYDYVFNGEEVLNTKLGQMNTIHLHRTNDDGDETIDLWLAPNYLHLPVKITQTNKKGTIELNVTRLQTEAPESKLENRPAP